MRRFTKIFAGFFTRLMAASWLFLVVLSALCCCCCLGGGATTAYGSDEVLYYPASCCCQTLFGRWDAANQSAASHSVAECRGTTCATCDSYGCFRGLDGRRSTLRRRQLEGSEKPITKLVSPCPGVLSGCDSRWPAPSWADACDKGAALSAAERCVSLQRLLL
jgi:hypothetical protein